MTLVYFTMSLRITSAKRSAVPPTGSYCCDSSFSRRSGCSSTGLGGGAGEPGGEGAEAEGGGLDEGAAGQFFVS